MPPISFEILLERNKQYAKSHSPLPTVAEAQSNGHDFRRTIIITCADNRVNPELILQTQPEEGIIVCRNTGGRVAAAIPDIMALDGFLKIDSIVILHHTDCGASHFTNEGIRKVHRERLPGHPEIDHMEFGAFNDLEQSVLDDLKLLKTSPYVPKTLSDHSYGYIYDIKTGLVRQIQENLP